MPVNTVRLLETPPQPSLRRRRWWPIILGIGLLLFLLAGGYVLLIFYLSDRNLRLVRAEADRLDPGWRLEELEARRAALADDQNAALVILSAVKSPAASLSTGPKWTDHGQARNEIARLTPTEQLDSSQISLFKAALAEVGPALAEARKIIALPYGRYPVSYGRDGISTNQSYLNDVREVELWLSLDVVVRAHEQDIDDALASCRGLVNVARSIGDQPLVISQLARMQIRQAACRRIERVLAQGEPSEAALATMQRSLEQEEAEPLFLYGARGARGCWDRFFEAVKAGQALPSQLLNRLGPALAVGSHPATLELASRIVEIAKLPVEEQFPQLEEPGLFDEKNYPLLAGLYLVPRVRKESSDLHEGQASSQAELRRALAAIASERYRRVHGSWPVSLAALVPDYLPRVPADPYDGGPFRFQRLDNSLVIDYVTNSGFRLWDAPQRRQPAHARE
jgi:hypothetical protein